MYTKEDLRKAFRAGENWGVAYSGWFTPCDNETEDKFNGFVTSLIGDMPVKLYNKEYNSYCTWNGSAYVNDGKVPGAYFYGLEKAANNGFYPVLEDY